MTTTYCLEIKGGGAVPLTARTDVGALRQARKFARDNRVSVYLCWDRDTDGCGGYLDANGNAGPIGTLIRPPLAAAVTLGRKGGSVKSAAKAKSSRENGKKGGRPKRQAKD